MIISEKKSKILTLKYFDWRIQKSSSNSILNLSLWCFRELASSTPKLWFRLISWNFKNNRKNTQNQNFVLNELYFQKLEYDPIFVGFGWKVDGWKGKSLWFQVYFTHFGETSLSIISADFSVARNVVEIQKFPKILKSATK